MRAPLAVRLPAAAARPRGGWTMWRHFRSVLFLVPLLALGLGLLAPRPASALPLWARQYSMPCTQCHLAFPRLNDFGMKFRQRGYIMEGSEGQSPWESQNFPLSLIASVGYNVASTNHYDSENAKWTRFTQAGFVQNQVEFHTAGTLAKKVTFHFDNNFGDLPAGDGVVLFSGMAFVQFDDVAKDGKLNVKVGIYDAEIPYLSSSRRTTLQDYAMPATLDARGIELNGAQQGWTYALGLINSGRTVEGTQAEKPGTKFLNNLENPYLWVMRDLGAHRVTARVVLDRQDPRKADASAANHIQADLSALLAFPRFWIIPDFTYESFGDVDSASVAKSIQRGLLETTVLLDKNNKWLLTGRYELAHNASRTPAVGDLVPEADASLATLDLSYFVNPNAKIALDWARTWANDRGMDRVDQIQALVHIGY
jgi:hypothetical protein